MARELTPIQIESIRAARLAGSGVRETAREVGCSPAAVRKYGDIPDDVCAQLRTQKTADAIEQIAAARAIYLEHLMDATVVKEATARDTATIIGILTDKHQLLTGAATARTESGPPDSGRFTLDEIEKLAAVAERVKAGVS